VHSNLLTLSDLNQSQRLTIGCAAALLIVLFFLHNPLSGYKTTYSYSYQKVLEPCPPEDKEKYKELLVSIYRSDIGKEQRRIAEALGGVEKEIERRIKNCHLLAPGLHTDSSSNSELVERDLPFEQWGTVNPLVEWLKPLVTFIYAALMIVSISAVFVGFVFRQKSRD
jgi:hypothetical protein